MVVESGGDGGIPVKSEDLRADRPVCAPGVDSEDGEHCFPAALVERIAEDVGAGSSSRAAVEEKTGCDSERCLVSKVSSGELRKEAAGHLRPQAPEQWRGDPTAWLSNHDIDRVMRQYADCHPDFAYLGALPLDFDAKGMFTACRVNAACELTLADLARRRQRYLGVIVNTDPQGKPGRHWMACFLNVGSGVFTFFDSVGKPPRPEIRGFCERLAEGYRGTCRYPATLRWSTKRFQHANTECGVYAALFLATMADGGSFRKFLRNRMNDEDVNALRRRFFDFS